jgi:UDP-N-acetylmuramyl pentapeptide phosphotransferase/UDP-N-acetylglucosamine-1-phosphate transferase
MQIEVALLIASFAISVSLTAILCKADSPLRILDHPNERSLHTVPTPRTGGIAVVLAIVASSVAAILWIDEFSLQHACLGISFLIVSVVSFTDDRLSLGPGIRLMGQVLASAILIGGGFVVSVLSAPYISFTLPYGLTLAVSLLFIVWMTNLYNFMDGMDGFAGGMAVLGFGTLAIHGWINGDHLFSTLNLIVAASAGGFLIFNFPPARIFMGDTGSSTLGFMAAAMSLWGDMIGAIPLWISMLVFSPFVVDASITLLRRIVRGEKFWLAHKTHYYQRLVQAGWGHRKAVIAEYGLMLACSAVALGMRETATSIQISLLFAVLVLYVAFFTMVRHAEKRAKYDVSSVD